MGPRVVRGALLLALATGGSSTALADDGRGPAAAPTSAQHAHDEKVLEGRLLAPCCYVQTLDVHESPMATELRLEVRNRLASGESAQAIEDDFVARYGERVRALPKGQDPRRGMVYLSLGVLVLGAVGLGALLRRWRRASREAESGPAPKVARGAHDALDDRIDEDLRAMEG